MPSSNMGAIPQDLAPQASQDQQQEQILEFVDNNPSVVQDFKELSDPTFWDDYLPNAELADFLERPVLISTITWTEGTPYLAGSLSPWHLFFTNSVIKKKIDNYAFVNCKLHMKVVVNASPFYFGAMLVSYRPLITHGIDNALASDGSSFVTHSQRPHFWILPQNNAAGELVAPFFYPKNWLDLTNTTDLTNMGRLDFQAVVPLLNANTVSSGSIEAQVYAWASDVRITGPTYQLQAGKSKIKTQQRDEYSMGPVERVSTTVADIAQRLSDVPVIAPFAKATEYGSRALSKIAALFGWTNVPVITDAEPFKSVPFHGFASASIAQPIEKLTIDPKNELTIDPRTVGLGDQDELSICSLVGRETFITEVVWDESATSDTLLFAAQVSPVTSLVLPGVHQTTVCMSPMAMVATNFREWRGDIVYRFKAICTQYHKGRLRITWDPIADVVANSATTQTSYTRIVDLSPDMDIEVRVSYLQDRMFMNVGNPASPVFQTSSFTLAPDRRYANGMLTVRVLNRLTSPGSNSSVSLLTFVRGADNLRFMNPIVPLHNTGELRKSYFTVQAGDIMNIKEEVDDGTVTSIFGGESLLSLRPLLRRTSAAVPVPFTGVNTFTTDAYSILKHAFTKFPLMPGYVVNGYMTVESKISPATPRPGNVDYYSFFHHIVPCFLGMRGSMMWHLNPNGIDVVNYANTFKNSKVSRTHSKVPLIGTQYNRLTVTNSGNVNPVYNVILNDVSGAGGTSYTNQETQAGLSILCPHYNPNRFIDTNPEYWSVGKESDESAWDTYQWTTKFRSAFVENYMHTATLEKFYSIGPDFNVFFFCNVPPTYLYDTQLSPFPPVE